jgi:hypothetical protein
LEEEDDAVIEFLLLCGEKKVATGNSSVATGNVRRHVMFLWLLD